MKTQSVQLSLVRIPVSNIDTAVLYYRDMLFFELYDVDGNVIKALQQNLDIGGDEDE